MYLPREEQPDAGHNNFLKHCWDCVGYHGLLRKFLPKIMHQNNITLLKYINDQGWPLEGMKGEQEG